MAQLVHRTIRTTAAALACISAAGCWSTRVRSKAAFRRGNESPKQGWAEIADELEALVSAEDKAGLIRATQYAHYTPEYIIRALWQTVVGFGFAVSLDVLFDIERDINGQPAGTRQAVRQELSVPLVGALETWLRQERIKLSRHDDLAIAMDYMLTRWKAFTRFLDDGRICLSNNAAERAIRGIALGRKSWLFAGSDRGGRRAAIMYSLIVTAKMNNVDPQAWLTDVLGRIAEHPAQKLKELLPWNWIRPETAELAAKAA